MPPGAQGKILELGGHKGTLCCDWSTANQSGTCITGGAEGKREYRRYFHHDIGTKLASV